MSVAPRRPSVVDTSAFDALSSQLETVLQFVVCNPPKGKTQDSPYASLYTKDAFPHQPQEMYNPKGRSLSGSEVTPKDLPDNVDDTSRASTPAAME